MTTTNDEIPLAHLEFIINHVFLPPRLPSTSDENSRFSNAALLKAVHAGIKDYKVYGETPENHREVTTCVEMLSTMCELETGDTLDVAAFSWHLHHLKLHERIVLHIAAQNAGIIITRASDHFVFASFEASPKSSAVMQTTGKLICSYPGPCVAIRAEVVLDINFTDTLVLFLEQMKQQKIIQAFEQGTKAGTMLDEERETAHPKFITCLLGGILRALGGSIEKNVRRIQKRIADDVVWEASSVPWRRSPLWLVIRVALQLTLPDVDYKAFILFFMCRLLQAAIKLGGTSEMIHFMNAKISRRILKLDTKVPSFLTSAVTTVGSGAAKILQKRWQSEIQRCQRTTIWNPVALSIKPDIRLVMGRSKSHLLRVKHMVCDNLDRTKFVPKEFPRVEQTPKMMPPLTQFKNPALTDADKEILLADFETWVQYNLDNWLKISLEVTNTTCSNIILNRSIDYMMTAKAHYKRCPEKLSAMILTIMELWVAMDKIATKTCRLLKDYYPMFSSENFHALLLPQSCDLLRLKALENYLQTRHREAKYRGITSIFTEKVDAKTFSVRYFDQSENHKRLKLAILKRAENERKSILIKFRADIARYEDLMAQSNMSTCKYKYDEQKGIAVHHDECSRCKFRSQANHIKPDIHEWPLPEGDLESKAVVFELACPLEFSVWRDMTFMIINDVGYLSPGDIAKSKRGYLPPIEELHNYSGLRKHFRAPPLTHEQRLKWCSYRKSFYHTHYNSPPMPTTEDNIGLPHALRYGLWDTEKHIWAEGIPAADLAQVCVFHLPEGPYKKLQYSVYKYSLDPNQIMARVSECSQELSVHEYVAFGSLRAGPKIQWRNILRELKSRTLTFGNESVGMLLMQTAWQAGEPGATDAARMSHDDLLDLRFGEALLNELMDALSVVEMNWQEAGAVHIYVVIALKVLTLTPHLPVRELAVKFLREARNITLSWVRSLCSKLPDVKESDMHEAQLRVVQLAAICRTTFNIGESQLDLLLSTSEDIAVVMECATMIHQNETSMTTDSTLHRTTKALVERDRRLSYAIEGRLRKLITQCRCGIDLSPIWSGYRGGSIWTALPAPNDRWVMMNSRVDQKELLEVHYNLLTGQILIGGLPLGRMQAHYTAHPSYIELFGEKVLEVFPSTMRGMAFQTRSTFSGFEIHFGMAENDTQLVIRTRRQDNLDVIHQFIPRDALRDDFPTHIVDAHHHWFDIHKEVIELRDIERPWQIKSPSWHVIDAMSSTSMMFLGKDENLIDGYSRTAKMVHAVLGPLEYHKYIDIRLSRSTGQVNVHLPRLKLDFYFDSKGKALHCRQFQDMVVDDNQDIGTLIGLENRLVVRVGKTRSVIIPHGKLSVKTFEAHVAVSIDTTDPASIGRVKYHSYNIDPILGRLVGNGSLLSHLYLCYLHALTAYCSPDPLTGRTGTEQAIAGLRSATSWSFQNLEPEGPEAEIFRNIASLTPRRQFYPPHMKVMQEVVWDPVLPGFAQHDAFHELVDAVSKHASRFHIFHPDLLEVNALYYKPIGDRQLLVRAAARNGLYTPGCARGDKKLDVVYQSRDIPNKEPLEARVWQIATIVNLGPPKLKVTLSLKKIFEKWNLVKGKLIGDEKVVVGYDPRWLNLTESLRDSWCPLYEMLTSQHANLVGDYRLMFLLSTLAFSGSVEIDLICSLFAVATNPSFRQIRLPKYALYDLTEGFAPNKDLLVRVIKECLVDKEARMLLHQELEELEEVQFKLKIARVPGAGLDTQAQQLAKEFCNQWPCEELQQPTGQYSLLDVNEAISRVEPYFRMWFQNSALEEYIDSVQELLKSVYLHDESEPVKYVIKPMDPKVENKYREIELKDVFKRRVPILPPPPQISKDDGNKIEKPGRKEVEGLSTQDQLNQVLTAYGQHRKQGFATTYIRGLVNSLEALRDVEELEISGAFNDDDLEEFRQSCSQYVARLYQIISAGLTPRKAETANYLCYKAGLWPCLSPVTLLQQLAENNSLKLPDAWKTAFVQYGIAITRLQWVERLLGLNRSSNDWSREASNMGHENWEPTKSTDWLLMEIENNMLVRRVQAEIALQMISPPDYKNAIVQLLMGEGKTSVLTPIIASALANGKTLVRVIVLKPLSAQMYQTLVQRLGGLINRRIFFMPFSRSIKMGPKEAKIVREIFEDCMKTGGILLAQPEHVLSFKLLGYEWLFNALKKVKKNNQISELSAVDKYEGEIQKCQVGQTLVEAQRWLEQTSRDILDECDEILNVKHELIYSIGNPTPIQNHPDRWIVIQEVFDLIHDYFRMNRTNINPIEFEVSDPKDDSRFPCIRILSEPKGAELLKELAKQIVSDGLPAINFRFLGQDKRRQAWEFIAKSNIDKVKGESLLEHCGHLDDDISTSTLVLLRGLFAHHILFFVFKEKRWKVDYGLDLRRTMLAVPYRAKDSPAGRAEFSHPDVSIALTCLSYYYGGLSEAQLETCFRILYKADNPNMQYDRWTRLTKMSNKLRNLGSINLDDTKQWRQIYNIFKFNKTVIDFYLANIVFPREAKEFKHKLSTSGWDIAAEKTHPTTGFSGTNDNRYLLPLGIDQYDRKAQEHTNAVALTFLLAEGNTYAPVSDDDERLTFTKLLRMFKTEKKTNKLRQPVRVLLDVGAQVLELQNEQVAEKWLAHASREDVEAAVYFDDNDVLTVITRDGIKEALMVSEYARKLEKCVVYLDEAHTRGTDLRLPEGSRAAVTLGPGLTKDRMVQACMRMRRLGHGHSVVFCAPLEIQRKLEKIAAKDRGRTQIKVCDIIFWTMDQSCITHRKLVPIWAKQGVSYQKRFVAAQKLHASKSKVFPADVLEKEAKTLIEHYGFNQAETDSVVAAHPAKVFRRKQFAEIEERCRTANCESFRHASLVEQTENEQEQQRELYHEIECEREDQRAGRAGPAQHNVTPSARHLVATGQLPRDSKGDIFPAFTIFEDTSAPSTEVNAWSQKLLVTKDFRNVINTSGKARDCDHFLRPVHWILWTTLDPKFLLIISPFEANHLLQELKVSRYTRMHMYTPRVTIDAKPYDKISKSMPPLLIDQLNLFAGQLYLPDYAAYLRIMSFLGLCLHDDSELDTDIADLVASDGFVEKQNREKMRMKAWCPFNSSPVLFLRAVIGIRRRGGSYLGTHMGQILHGRPLKPDDFRARVPYVPPVGEEEDEEESVSTEESEEPRERNKENVNGDKVNGEKVNGEIK
ncbi:hypothetical protein EDC01DRAFT_638496 [Geopyxis carbonaria]|nr:hypothetical protein EDC01DRAFT_638496 [Geopyxis carbonaria]